MVMSSSARHGASGSSPVNNEDYGWFSYAAEPAWDADWVDATIQVSTTTLLTIISMISLDRLTNDYLGFPRRG